MKYVLVFLVLSALLLAYTSPVLAQATGSEAELAVALAEEAFLSMEEAGFNTLFPRDVFSEAKEALEVGDYDEALEKSGLVVVRSERAFRIGDSIGALGLRIQDLETRGLEVSRARDLMSAAFVAFDKENFDEAEEFVFQGNEVLDDVEAEYSILRARYNAARGNLLTYLRGHIVGIIAFFILLALIGVVLYVSASKVITVRRIRDLELEKDVLRKMMEKSQAQYYKEASISKSAFEIKREVYGKRVMEIEKELPVLNSRSERFSQIPPFSKLP